MKALTLAQPVASAMIHGGKYIENRTWRPAEAPGLVAVHAGSKWWAGPGVKAKTTARPNLHGLDYTAQRWVPWGEMPPPEELPTRAFVGVISVTSIEPVDRVHDSWAIGPWCWMVDHVWALDEPIPWRTGRLGLWTIPDGPELDALARLVGVRLIGS